MIWLRMKITMLRLKRVVTLLFFFGIIGIIVIKPFYENSETSSELSRGDYNIKEDEGYTRRLPHFLIIGAKKCGTSTLQSYLLSHPDVKAYWGIEPHFFDEKFEKGLDYYKSFMMKSYPHQLTFEKSADYWNRAPVPERVYQSLGPKMKFILMLRDPVDRLHSDYSFNRLVLYKNYNMSEEDHTLDELLFLPGTKTIDKTYPPVTASSYDDNMKRWLQFYPLESFLLTENDDLSEKPYEVLQEVETFLGIKHYFSSETVRVRRVNAARKPYSFMSDTTRDILIDYFRPHSLNFFRIVNRTFSWTLYP